MTPYSISTERAKEIALDVKQATPEEVWALCNSVVSLHAAVMILEDHASGLEELHLSATRERDHLRALLARLEYASGAQCPVCDTCAGSGHAPSCEPIRRHSSLEAGTKTMSDSSSNIFQLGKALYIAHCREAVNQMGKDFDEWTGGEEKVWAELHPDSRACWYAAAEKALELIEGYNNGK